MIGKKVNAVRYDSTGVKTIEGIIIDKFKGVKVIEHSTPFGGNMFTGSEKYFRVDFYLVQTAHSVYVIEPNEISQILPDGNSNP